MHNSFRSCCSRAAFALLVSPVFVSVALGDGPKTIDDFVGCLNTTVGNMNLKAPGIMASIANSSCVPTGCKLTVTMSAASAQGGCLSDTIANAPKGIQLPRVILSCAGPANQQRFRPSFSLCPVGSPGANGVLGANRVEVGEDVDDKVNMKMADVPFSSTANFAMFNKNADGVFEVFNIGNNKSCLDCHGKAAQSPIKIGNTALDISKQVSPFVTGKKNQGVQFVIHTTEPNKAELVKPEAPFKAQSLADVCTDITKNLAAFPAASKPNADLCTALQAYAKSRACGKSTLPDGTALACAGATGGGLFLGASGLSAVTFDLSGEAKITGASSYGFQDLEGSVSAFNYATHTLVDSVVLSSLSATAFGNGDFTMIGSGTALLNGSSPASVTVTISKLSGALSFLITSSGTGMALAGGTGQAGAVLDININAGSLE